MFSYPKHGLNFSSSHAGYSNSIYEDDRMRPTSGNESIYGVREVITPFQSVD